MKSAVIGYSLLTPIPFLIFWFTHPKARSLNERWAKMKTIDIDLRFGRCIYDSDSNYVLLVFALSDDAYDSDSDNIFSFSLLPKVLMSLFPTSFSGFHFV